MGNTVQSIILQPSEAIDHEMDSDEESVTGLVSVPHPLPVRDETGLLPDSQWNVSNAMDLFLGENLNGIVPWHTYVPKTYPGLFLFELAEPIPYCEDDGARKMFNMYDFNSKLRTVSTGQDRLVCTMSDGYIFLPSPPTEYIQHRTNIYPGHLHFHRNRLADTITLWMFGADENWIDCTEVYAQPTDDPIRHPRYPHLILSTRSDFNWAPCYISDVDFKKRNHSLGSLKHPFVQKVFVKRGH